MSHSITQKNINSGCITALKENINTDNIDDITGDKSPSIV